MLQWTYYRRPAFTIAFLATSAYLAVLYALSITPLSLFAPAREASIVIGTFLGATVLGEGYKKRRDDRICDHSGRDSVTGGRVVPRVTIEENRE